MSLKMNVAVILIVLASASLILAEHLSAANRELNLPATPVTIEVYNGTMSYFNTSVSNVPRGFDVVNGTYPGWCVDARTEMARSPATHAVILHSTSDPPGELANEKWDMVNYVLNHKQGAVRDIQQAIWYFVNMDGNYTPTTAVAWAIVNDALANGTGFVSAHGQVIAVVCYPIVLFPSQPNIQISIIEVRIPSSLLTDLNRDGEVNILDISIVAVAYGSKPGDLNWNPTADLDGNGLVNIIDVSRVALDFGKTANP